MRNKILIVCLITLCVWVIAGAWYWAGYLEGLDTFNKEIFSDTDFFAILMGFLATSLTGIFIGVIFLTIGKGHVKKNNDEWQS